MRDALPGPIQLPSLRAWAAGACNFGWVFLNSTTDGMEFRSSEYATAALRPRITVTFVPPATPPAVPALSGHGLVALLVGLTFGFRFPLRESIERVA